MNTEFLKVVEATVDQLELFRVCISAEGDFYVPNEKDGKLSLLSTTTRKKIGEFAREFSDRMNCPDPKHKSSRTVTRARTRKKKERRG